MPKRRNTRQATQEKRKYMQTKRIPNENSSNKNIEEGNNIVSDAD